MRIRKRVALLAITLGSLAFVLTAQVGGYTEPLKTVHQGTVADCPSGVTWHFVHNQTEATEGTITVGAQKVANGAPFDAAVLHYWVTTADSVLPLGVSDDVEGGNLVLSHYDCATPITTTTEPTTTTQPPTTTTTTRPPTTSTTEPATTTTTDPTTTTTQATTTTTRPPLPFTGMDTSGLLVAALALLGLGALTLRKATDK